MDLGVYKRLTMSQKYICNLIQDYDKFAPEIKDKYTSVCKTKMFDKDMVTMLLISQWSLILVLKTSIQETMLLKEKINAFR